MIEQKLENIIVNKFREGFLSADIPGVQIIGAWTPAAELKAHESSEAEAVLAVTVNPRQYETPTIPDAQFSVSLALAVRAEIDKGGTGYLDITEKVSDILQRWQSDFSAVQSDFAIDGEFSPTGYQIQGGEAGLDRATCTWTYTQSFSVLGIVEG